jgi:hypothetical protein
VTLQSQIPFKKQSNNLIDYRSNILLIGSCFVENIGDKLDYFKFRNSQNPLGILFHPMAIENLIANAVKEKVYTENDIFFHNEQWHCFDAHSRISNLSKDTLLDDLNNNIKSTKRRIEESTHVFITLGTSWVYRHIETNRPVANCHKIPQKLFLKELLSVDEISKSIDSIVSLVKSVKEDASIIFTVSPVRHIKDGFVENTLSKANLISGIHTVLLQQLNSKCHYFPSYEIMLDELRDYRFYKEDMLHPNETAINYIWEKFQQTWINESASKTMRDVEDVQKGIQHKPFNQKSKAHLNFLQNLEDKKQAIKLHFPYIVF